MTSKIIYLTKAIRILNLRPMYSYLFERIRHVLFIKDAVFVEILLLILVLVVIKNALL